MPGQEKIVSVTIAPEKRNGISRATFVTTGSIALRKACLPITTALAAGPWPWPCGRSPG